MLTSLPLSYSYELQKPIAVAVLCSHSCIELFRPCLVSKQTDTCVIVNYICPFLYTWQTH